eukprot:11842236-Heterocapsa_arctica.AAC.1
MICEQLYPAISQYQPDRASEIMSMLLQMSTPELLPMLESEQQLRAKVDEALIALRCHELLGSALETPATSASASRTRSRGTPSQEMRDGKS